jgi:ABC-type nitrate/sulfonate/bicarbonate transport system substrate-binding protein
MTGQLASGYLDGFCVGDPYNTAAEDCGAGRVLLATTELIPNHPEKVLAVNRGWLTRHGDVAVAVVRAVLRACAFCHDPAHTGRLAEILARPAYLDLPASLVADCLSRREKPGGGVASRNAVKPTASGFDPADMFPSATHAAWMVHEMIRWGHLPPDTDMVTTARRSVQADVFRKAVEGSEIPCPDNDFSPMRLRTGWFDALDASRPKPTPASRMTTALL